MILRCNANRTELTARMRSCTTGGGQRHVNRMRKADFFYSIPYVDALQFSICKYHSLSILVSSWFFGAVKLQERELVLMRPGNETGVFLIVNHDTKGSHIATDWFGLSLKADVDNVRHYRIKTTDTGNYFIAKGPEFGTLQDLIAYYSKSSDGLVTTLKKAALKVNAYFITLKLYFLIHCNNFTI